MSPRVQKLLVYARQEADNYHLSYVDTEQLLAGLLKMNEGIAIETLKKLGIDLARLEDNLRNGIQQGTVAIPPTSLPHTSSVGRTLKLAEKEARSCGHAYVGTEHILLGLLRLSKGGAYQSLKNANVSFEAVRCILMDKQNAKMRNPDASGNTP